MLTLALVATLIGFGLLVVALITTNFWLAVACIVVCVIGLLVLLLDTIRSSRRGAGTGDEPLFTIRERESGERAAPLHGDDTAIRDAGSGTGSPDAFGAEAPVVSVPMVDSGPGLGSAAPVPGGLGSLVERGAGATGSPSTEAQIPGAPTAGPATDADLTTGDANDYVKSVTGSFPVQSPPSGPWPAASSPIPSGPSSGRVPSAGPGEATAIPGTPAGSTDRPPFAANGPDTGPLPAVSPYVGRRRRAAEEEGDLPDQEQAPETPAAPAPSTAFRPAGPAPAAWTRQSEPSAPAQSGSDGLVVHDHTGPLPKMTFKNEEE